MIAQIPLEMIGWGALVWFGACAVFTVVWAWLGRAGHINDRH